ncbi:ATP-dependent DNA ligase [Lactifluus subvellereus]|nr:ATP-dependent DNA ligase [Lactifluus subvellereus]
MSKRISTNSSPNNKRARSSSQRQRPSQADQLRIDSFFKPPCAAANVPAESLNSNLPASPRPTQSSISHRDRATPVISTIIDVDLASDSEDIQEIPATLSESFPASRGAVLERIVATDATSATDQPPQYPSLSVDPASFVTDTCPWPTKTQAPYSFLVHSLCALSATRSRVTILNTLTNALRAILRYHPPSMLPSLYLLSNSLAPPYVPIELGLGQSIISKAIQHVSGVTPATLKRFYNQTGDPGDVAFLAKCNVRTLVPHAPLSIQGVYEALLNLANIKGKGAVSLKQAMVEKLLVSAKGEETRYLVRTLSQHIRVGAVRTTILTALARALVLTPPATVINSTGSSYTASAELLAQVRRASTISPKKKEESSRTLLLEKFAVAEALLKRVFVQHPNYGHIISAILEVGLDGLAERVILTIGTCTPIHTRTGSRSRVTANPIGIPLQPTLGSPMRSLDGVYQRVGGLAFTAEFKYDGQRVQIHAEKSDVGKLSVNLFSRHLEDMTEKYPDVVYLVQSFFAISQDISSFIVDAEIVAIDTSGDSLKSFQELSNRARKDVKFHEIKVSVCVYAFDLMYLNGQSLLQESFRRRRNLLRTHFPAVQADQPGAAKFDHVESCESEEGRKAIEGFWLRAVDSRCEGLMIKLLDHGEVLEATGPRKDTSRKHPLPATYEPDKRTSAWLKLKKDYVKGLGDTLDVVPIGAWHGNGRKAQWWSPVLLAARDTRTDRFVATFKCMSGFSDSFYKVRCPPAASSPTSTHALICLRARQSMRDRYSEGSENCSKLPLWGEVETGGYSPSVYFRPHEVWEIRGADVTLSPVSVAAKGLVSEDKGLSLRFPRFVRVREDKCVEQASSTDFLAGMYRKQQEGGKGRGSADDGQLIDPALSDTGLDDDWESDELG